MKADSGLSVPFRFKSADDPIEDRWSSVHNFFHGWGLVHGDGRSIWAKDACRYLDELDIFVLATKEEIEDVYERLREPLHKEAERISKLPPPKFDRLVIPKINKPFPKLPW